MKAVTNNIPISDNVGNFCAFISQAQKDYDWANSELARLNDLVQDYLHKLELEKLNYRERAKVATQIAKCRRQRRKAKNKIETLDPLMEFVSDKNNKLLIDKLRNVLGQMRKAEGCISNRKYTYKVLKE